MMDIERLSSMHKKKAWHNNYLLGNLQVMQVQWIFLGQGIAGASPYLSFMSKFAAREL
jgi:Uri superfamily endonuclease